MNELNKSIKNISGSGGLLGGGGSGGTSKPDTLFSRASFKLLDLLCEGEIDGLVNGGKSIYINNTPLVNSDGSYAFAVPQYSTYGISSNAVIGWRYGTQAQSYMPPYADSVESETTVDQVCHNGVTVSRLITNPTINAIKVRLEFPAFQEVRQNGDVVGSNITYKIQLITGNGSPQTIFDEHLVGKASSTFDKQYRVSVTGAGPWTVIVLRTSPDPATTNIQNSFLFKAYSEIVDSKFSYPNSAIIGLVLDARQFSSIPTRGYDIKGLKIKVPNSATPRADGSLTFPVIWNGGFNIGWCADPVWCLYDLMTNARYGAGIDPLQIDKWAFYTISQYCNELVPDGKGGQEPRFTLNTYIQTSTPAFDLINALSSVFRGMAYYAEGRITVVQDAPTNPSRIFSNVNVANFRYSSSALKSRHTVAKVTWNDPSDFYRQNIEVIEDKDGISQYGIKIIEITAFGCTSRGQSHRVGKWHLFSERLETETVSFEIGAEGISLRPGEIIQIGDSKKAGQRFWGRIEIVTSNSITIDAPINLQAGITYTLSIINSSGGLNNYQLNNAAGNSINVLTTATSFTSPPVPGGSWLVSSASFQPQLFRVLSITEVDTYRFEVTGLVHYPGKYAAIEQDIALSLPPTSLFPPHPPNPPTNVVLTSTFIISAAGVSTLNLSTNWNAPVDASGLTDPFTAGYQVEFIKGNNGSWTSAGAETSATHYDLLNQPPDNYSIRVRAANISGDTSAWAYSTAAVLPAVPTPAYLLNANQNATITIIATVSDAGGGGTSGLMNTVAGTITITSSASGSIGSSSLGAIVGTDAVYASIALIAIVSSNMLSPCACPQSFIQSANGAFVLTAISGGAISGSAGIVDSSSGSIIVAATVSDAITTTSSSDSFFANVVLLALGF